MYIVPTLQGGSLGKRGLWVKGESHRSGFLPVRGVDLEKGPEKGGDFREKREKFTTTRLSTAPDKAVYLTYEQDQNHGAP
jgi:hypothetical protein